MKTLKQRFDKTTDLENMIWVDDALECVGEWLKQKHAKESNKERMYLLQELLGELEK